MVHADCGELHGEAAARATERLSDPTGDPYEDFPEDQGEELKGTEIVKIITDLKDFGNKAFKNGDLAFGLDKYQKGLRYLHEYSEPLENDPPELGPKLNNLRFTLHSNSALLQLKLQDYDEARTSAINALEIEGATPAERGKALYRRALAQAGSKDEDAAIEDLDEALKLVPGDAAITNELATVKRRVAERTKKEKAAYRKFFQ